MDLSVAENDKFSDLIDRLELDGGIQWTKEHRVYLDKNNQLEELTGPPPCVSHSDTLYTGGRQLRNLGLGDVVNIDIFTPIPIAYFVQGSHLVVRRNGYLENCKRAMKISIKISPSPTDEEFDVLALPHDTIDDFELLIQKQKGIAPWSQTLHTMEKI